MVYILLLIIPFIPLVGNAKQEESRCTVLDRVAQELHEVGETMVPGPYFRVVRKTAQECRLN